MTKFSLSILALAAVALESAQTPSSNAGAFGVPTNFSGSYLIQRKTSLAVAEIPVKTWTTKNSNLTFQWEGLGGYNVTSASAAFGTAFAAHYAVNPILSFTIGVGATVPVSSFTWSKVNADTVGLLVGASFKF